MIEDKPSERYLTDADNVVPDWVFVTVSHIKWPPHFLNTVLLLHWNREGGEFFFSTRRAHYKAQGLPSLAWGSLRFSSRLVEIGAWANLLIGFNGHTINKTFAQVYYLVQVSIYLLLWWTVCLCIFNYGKVKWMRYNTILFLMHSSVCALRLFFYERLCICTMCEYLFMWTYDYEYDA